MPQLRQVHIENYRCLRSVDLDFEPLTVLVGCPVEAFMVTKWYEDYH